MIRALLAASLALAAGGCVDTTPLIDALAKDQNAVCVRVTTLYGSAELNRNHGCELGSGPSSGAITVPSAAPAP